MKKLCIIMVLVTVASVVVYAGTAGVTNTVTKSHQPNGRDNGLQQAIITTVDAVITKMDAMTTTDGISPVYFSSEGIPSDVYQPVSTMITESTTNRVCTSADYGSWIMITSNATNNITLPANAATAGSWIGFMSGNGVTDDCAPTISPAVADTLVGLNDATAGSITYGSSNRVGFRVLFVSDGTKWHVYNRCINTMTLNT